MILLILFQIFIIFLLTYIILYLSFFNKQLPDKIINESEYILKLNDLEKVIVLSQQIFPNSSFLNTSICCELKSSKKKNIQKFSNCVKKLIKMVVKLRINQIYENEKNEYFSKIQKRGMENDVIYEYINLYKNGKNSSKEEGIKIIKKIIMVPMKIINKNMNKDQVFPFLCKFVLVKYDEKGYIFLMKFHHLIFDSKSGLMLSELLSDMYNNNQKDVNDDHDINMYKEYEMFLNNINKCNMKIWGDYWINKIKKCNLYFDFKLKKNDDSSDLNKLKGNRIYFEIDEKGIIDLVNDTCSTIFVTLSSIFGVFLYRYFQNNNFVLYYLSDSRGRKKKFQNLIGFFANLLLLKFDLQNNDDEMMNIKDVINYISKQRKEDRKRKHFCYLNMVKMLREEGIMFNEKSINVGIVETLFFPKFVFDDIETIDLCLQDYGEVQKDLCLYYQHLKDRKKIHIAFEYKNCVFEDSFIVRMKENFLTFLNDCIQNQNTNINKLKILSKNEISTIMNHDTIVSNNGFDKSMGISSVFKSVASKYPDVIAVKFKENVLTYKELDKYSDELSNKIKGYVNKGRNENDLTFVGVSLKKSVELIIAIIAVFKSGCVYTPLDSSLPVNRLKYIANDTKFSILISSTEVLDNKKFDFYQGVVLDVNEINFDNELVTESNMERLKGHHERYIIYTSGTTGSPKGCLIDGSGVVNVCMSYFKLSGLKIEDTYSLYCRITFDVSILEIFTPLLNSMTIEIIPEDIRMIPNELWSFLKDKRVNGAFISPSILKYLPRKRINSLKHLLIGGEKCERNTIKFWSKHCLLLNGYGPCECTIVTHICKWDDSLETTNIGRLVDNYYSYILDERLNLVPISVIGELYIGGLGVSKKGYLNLPELTREKFIKNPFISNEIIYKTGDLCRMTAKKEVVFIGRIDNQVKVRGFRIELGEIENVLRQVPVVKDSIVLIKKEEKEKIIVAFVVLKEEVKSKNKIKDELRIHVSLELPSYMAPNLFVIIDDSFPVNVNGKVDRTDLLKRIQNYQGTKNRKDDNSTLISIQLKALLSEILKKENIDLDSNFFEIGMNSLLIISFYNKLPSYLQNILSVNDVYSNPSCETLSNFILLKQKKEITNVEQKNNINDEDYGDKTKGDDKIAIIGMSCVLPGANDVEQFWSNILNHKVENESDYCIDDKKGFDHKFFNISKQVADIMNPSFRIFLEMCYNCLEDASYSKNMDEETCGIFCTIGDNSYFYENVLENKDSLAIKNRSVLLMYNSFHMFSGILSFYLNLQGPSMSINTTCSSSLSGINVACDFLLKKKCNVALVGGFKLKDINSNDKNNPVISKDGFNKAFDKDSSGTVMGEGGAVVLLKPLKEAIENRDYIYAVIRGSAINNDGFDDKKMSFVSPSVEGQSKVIKQALINARVNPETIAFVETHGTGTRLGDVIELNSLSRVFKQYTKKTGFCYLGSVKNNIGHLDQACGIASLIKCCLILKHKIIPGISLFKSSNPLLKIGLTSPFILTSKNTSWIKNSNVPLRIGLSSFGMGGNNAHTIIEEFSNEINDNDRDVNNYHLIVLSAKTEYSIDEFANRIIKYIKGDYKDKGRLSDISYTLMKRKEFGIRKFCVLEKEKGKSSCVSLKEFKKSNLYLLDKSKSKLIFLLPGFGSGYENMTKSLYKNFVYYKNTVNEIIETIRILYKIDLSMYFTENDSFQFKFLKDDQIDAQFLLFVVEYSLSKFLLFLGIEPSVIVGHSFGEFVAASLSSSISVEDSLSIIYERNKLMNQVQGGKMVVITCSNTDIISNYIRKINSNEKRKVLEISCINSPTNIVVSGLTKNISKLIEFLDELSIQHRTLNTSKRFHSSSNKLIREEFELFMRKFSFKKNKIECISSITGKNVDYSPEYFFEHLMSCVRFDKVISNLKKSYNSTKLFLIEVGPNCILTKLLMNNLSIIPENWLYISVSRHPKDHQAELKVFLEQIGFLWSNGIKINLENLHFNEKRYKIHLPHYPFDHSECWLYSKNEISTKESNNKSNLLGKKLEGNAYDTWNKHINLDSCKWIKDHVRNEIVVLPATFYIVNFLNCFNSNMIKNVKFVKLLKLEDNSNILFQTVKRRNTVEVFSRESVDQKWVLRSSCELCINDNIGKCKFFPENIKFIKKDKRGKYKKLTGIEFYRMFKTHGIDYGSSFQNVKEVYFGDEESLGIIKMEYKQLSEPTVMDSILQIIIASIEYYNESFILKLIKSIKTVDREINYKFVYVYTEIVQISDKIIESNVYVFDDENKVLMEIDGVILENYEKSTDKNEVQYLMEKKWINDKRMKNGENQIENYSSIIEKKSHGVTIYDQNDPWKLISLIQSNLEKLNDVNHLFIIILEDTVEFAEVYGVGKVVVNELNCVTKLITFSSGFKEINGKKNKWINYIIQNNSNFENDSFIDINNNSVKVRRLLKTSKFNNIDVEEYELPVQGSYVISGGLGGLGFSLFEFLAEKGAKYIIIVCNESTKMKKRQHRVISSMSKMGVNVYVSNTDITNSSNVSKMYEEIKRMNYPKVVGIFHLAATYKDQFISNILKETFERTVNVKKLGIINLVQGLKSSDLDFVIVFSSVSSIVGTPRETAYVAGNNFLERYVFDIQKMGFNAYSLCLACVKNVGVVARDHDSLRKAKLYGFYQCSLFSRQLFSTMFKILSNSVCGVYYFPFDFKKIIENLPMQKSLLENVLESETNITSDEMLLLTYDTLNNMIKNMLSMEEDIDIDQNLVQLGFDSLQAVELSFILRSKYNISVNQLEMVSGVSIKEILKRSSTSIMRMTENKFVMKHKPKMDNFNQFIPLSYAQKRLYFIDKSTEEKNLYLQHVIYVFKGVLNIEKFKMALNSMIERHESLRTIFVKRNGIPYQVILKSKKFELKMIENIKGNTLQKVIRKEINDTTFDLSVPLLLKGILIKENDNRYVFILLFHHILMDVYSLKVFLSQLSEVYNFSSLRNETLKDKGLFYQYSDFSYSQNISMSKEVLELQLEYWESKLSGFPQVLDISSKHSKKSNSGNSLSFSMSSKEMKMIQQYCRNENVTLFVYYIAVFGILLHKYSKQSKFLIGIPFSNRNFEQSENIIGFFVNVLPFPIDFSEVKTFSNLLQETKVNLYEIYQHQDTPFETIVDFLKVERGLNYRSPLYQICINKVLTNESIKFQMKGLEVESFTDSVEIPISKFDLTVFILEDIKELSIKFEYSTDLFDKSFIKRVNNHQQLIIRKIVNHDQSRPLLIKELLSIIKVKDQQLKKNDQESVETILKRNILVKDVIVIVFKEETFALCLVNPEKCANINNNQSINGWTELFNNVYDTNDKVEKDLLFNTAGWKNSYNGERFSDDEMKEWVDTTANLILSLKSNYLKGKKKALEIGCGTGLLMKKISKHFDEYFCTDISNKSIDNIKFLQEKYQLNNIKTFCQPAHDFTGLDNCNYDMIILNSVIQYFPSDHYLLDLLKRIFKCIKTSETIIFIGDVRNYDLLDLFQMSIQMKEKCGRKRLTYKEKELLFSPSYFMMLKSIFKNIKHIQIQPRLGKFLNEMNKFRYNVILYVNFSNLKLVNVKENKWFDYRLCGGMNGILDLLKRKTERMICIKNILNERLKDEILAYELESDGEFNGTYPHYLVTIANNYGLNVEFSWINSKYGSFDAYFSDKDHELMIYPMNETKNSIEKRSYTNKLVDYCKVREILTNYLLKTLPKRMIPSNFYFLENFPLMEDGMVDMKCLQRMLLIESSKSGVGSSDRLAVTEIEKEVSKIFGEILNIDADKIGVYSDFFYIGGHSLSAITLVDKIQTIFNVKIELRQFLKNRNIYNIAKMIANVDDVYVNQDNYILKIGGFVDDPILIFINSGFFSTINYKRLYELSNLNLSMYCIDNPRFGDFDNPFHSIKEIVQTYSKEIEKMNFKGNFIFVGFCFGGIIALELANYFKTKVKHVVLLDSYNVNINIFDKDENFGFENISDKIENLNSIFSKKIIFESNNLKRLILQMRKNNKEMNINSYLKRKITLFKSTKLNDYQEKFLSNLNVNDKRGEDEDILTLKYPTNGFDFPFSNVMKINCSHSTFFDNGIIQTVANKLSLLIKGIIEVKLDWIKSSSEI